MMFEKWCRFSLIYMQKIIEIKNTEERGGLDHFGGSYCFIWENTTEERFE